jgi:hypothetical protein
MTDKPYITLSCDDFEPVDVKTKWTPLGKMARPLHEEQTVAIYTALHNAKIRRDTLKGMMIGEDGSIEFTFESSRLHEKMRAGYNPVNDTWHPIHEDVWAHLMREQAPRPEEIDGRIEL